MNRLRAPPTVVLAERSSNWILNRWLRPGWWTHHNWNWFAEVEGPTGRTRSADPYQTNFIVIDEHCGTHFDAPTHFVPPPGYDLPFAGPLGNETGDRVPPGISWGWRP